MKRILPIAFFVLSLVACTKTSSETNEVSIRIENATAENFSNFTLNATEFGSISSGDTTRYVFCKDVLPIPFANLIAINNHIIYFVDIVPTPYMESGNYRMKIVSDTSSFKYKATFIKE